VAGGGAADRAVARIRPDSTRALALASVIAGDPEPDLLLLLDGSESSMIRPVTKD
jgi:hypothetical protein